MMLKIKSVCSLQEKAGVPRELKGLQLGGRILKERSSQRIKNMKSEQFEPTKFLTTCNKCLKVFSSNKGYSKHRQTCRLRAARGMRNTLNPRIIDLEDNSIPEDLSEYQNENFVRRSIRRIPTSVEDQTGEVRVSKEEKEEPLFLPNPFNESSKMLNLRGNRRGIKKRRKKRLRFTAVKAKNLAVKRQMKNILDQEKSLEKGKEIYYKFVKSPGKASVLKSAPATLLDEDSFDSYDDLGVSIQEPTSKMSFGKQIEEEPQKKKRQYIRKPILNLDFSKSEQMLEKFPKKPKTIKDSESMFSVINPLAKTNLFFPAPKINKPQIVAPKKLQTVKKLPKKRVTFSDTVIEHMDVPRRPGRRKKILTTIPKEITPISKIKSSLKKDPNQELPPKRRRRRTLKVEGETSEPVSQQVAIASSPVVEKSNVQESQPTEPQPVVELPKKRGRKKKILDITEEPVKKVPATEIPTKAPKMLPTKVVLTKVVLPKVVPSKVVPSKVVSAKVVPTKVVPSKVAPSKVVPSKIVTPKVVPPKVRAPKTARSTQAKVALTKAVLIKAGLTKAGPAKKAPVKAVPVRTVPTKEVPAKLNVRRHSVESVITASYAHLLHDDKCYSDSEISDPHSKINQRLLPVKSKAPSVLKRAPRRRKRKGFKFTVHKKKAIVVDIEAERNKPKRKYVRKKKNVPVNNVETKELESKVVPETNSTVSSLEVNEQIEKNNEINESVSTDEKLMETNVCTTETENVVENTEKTEESSEKAIESAEKEIEEEETDKKISIESIASVEPNSDKSESTETCSDSTSTVQNIAASSSGVSQKEESNVSQTETEIENSQDSLKESENVYNPELEDDQIFDSPKTTEKIDPISKDS